MIELIAVVAILIAMIFVGKAFYDLGRAEGSVAVKKSIRRALNELGVPGPGYPAPVANAVEAKEKGKRKYERDLVIAKGMRHEPPKPVYLAGEREAEQAMQNPMGCNFRRTRDGA